MISSQNSNAEPDQETWQLLTVFNIERKTLNHKFHSKCKNNGQYIRNRVKCKIKKRKLSSQLRATLPGLKITPHMPFTHSGVNNAWSFELKPYKIHNPPVSNLCHVRQCLFKLFWRLWIEWFCEKITSTICKRIEIFGSAADRTSLLNFTAQRNDLRICLSQLS